MQMTLHLHQQVSCFLSLFLDGQLHVACSSLMNRYSHKNRCAGTIVVTCKHGGQVEQDKTVCLMLLVHCRCRRRSRQSSFRWQLFLLLFLSLLASAQSSLTRRRTMKRRCSLSPYFSPANQIALSRLILFLADAQNRTSLLTSKNSVIQSQATALVSPSSHLLLLLLLLLAHSKYRWTEKAVLSVSLSRQST